MKGEVMKPFKGLHHITSMTKDVKENYDFLTQILGLKLIKKTVNQDDIHTYHTFYTDDVGSPGTDVTFFDFPNQNKGIKGSNVINSIGLLVKNKAALEYFKEHFEKNNVQHDSIESIFGTSALRFYENDGQEYVLYVDENYQGEFVYYEKSPIPKEYSIVGLGPVEIVVDYFDEMREFIETVYELNVVKEETDKVLFNGENGVSFGQLILVRNTRLPETISGYGQVHHVAFRVENDDELNEWRKQYAQYQIGNSGIVDRFYFKALYARVGHILFEISTDGPGFMSDEPYEELGLNLALPPKLKPYRDEIEKAVKPFVTK